MNERKLIAVPPNELNEVWPSVREGLTAVARFGDGWIPEDVYTACKNGLASLHFCRHGEDYEGFVVLSLRAGFQGPELLIWAGYSPHHGQPLPMWVDLITELARNAKAKRLVFNSPRKAWASVALEIGFKESQVTYSKEI